MSPRLLLTRPMDSAQEFAQAAQGAGWRGAIVIAPLLQIVPSALPEEVSAGVRTVILTSQHAVPALAQASRDLALWCVGPRTLQAARAAGFTCIRQSAGDGAALVADLLAQPPVEPILHLHGTHMALDVAARLRDAGLRARSLAVYDQVANALNDEGWACLTQDGDVVVPVFSPRSGRILGAELANRPDLGARVHLLALSAAVARALDPVPRCSLWVADQPDGGALLTRLIAMQAELEASANPR